VESDWPPGRRAFEFASCRPRRIEVTGRAPHAFAGDCSSCKTALSGAAPALPVRLRDGIASCARPRIYPCCLGRGARTVVSVHGLSTFKPLGPVPELSLNMKSSMITRCQRQSWIVFACGDWGVVILRVVSHCAPRTSHQRLFGSRRRRTSRGWHSSWHLQPNPWNNGNDCE